MMRSGKVVIKSGNDYKYAISKGTKSYTKLMAVADAWGLSTLGEYFNYTETESKRS